MIWPFFDNLNPRSRGYLDVYVNNPTSQVFSMVAVPSRPSPRPCFCSAPVASGSAPSG